MLVNKSMLLCNISFPQQTQQTPALQTYCTCADSQSLSRKWFTYRTVLILSCSWF